MAPKTVKPGEIISKIIYARVIQVLPADFSKFETVECIDLDDRTQFFMEGKELLDTCLSADEFSREVSLPLTVLAERFTTVGTRPFTVRFIKKNGEPRTIRGRMLTPDGILGRSTVLDFDAVKGSPLRQVDHRTLQSLVVSGTKFNLRKGN